MPEKEAIARIKINKLLEAAGWRFFQSGSAPANICLEPSVKIKSADLDALGNNFGNTSKGFIDFLLLDSKGFPFIVLEAKAEEKNPLVGKEQARKYARSQNCRFAILSNGSLHYFWDLERGNPYIITSFPTPDLVIGYQKVTPNPNRLIEEQVGDDYIVLTQRPNYKSEAGWRNETERPAYKTSKARVCVTVSMMTTGYDCIDILNLGLLRPIFSPTEFIQIKGRGTRKHNFLEQLFDGCLKDGILHPQKTAFKLFDFFANCEYFEEKFNYDEVLKLPRSQGRSRDDGEIGQTSKSGTYEHLGTDILASLKANQSLHHQRPGASHY